MITARDQLLTELLRNNRTVITARIQDDGPLAGLHVRIRESAHMLALNLPRPLTNLRIHRTYAKEIRTLEARHPLPSAADAHVACQNEPIKLGTQMQPAGAPWVGTAGSAVSWLDDANQRRFGVLTNWHVAATSRYQAGDALHQPDDTQPKFAELYDAVAPNPDVNCYIDAALCDSLINGFHTISDEIIGLGTIQNPPRDATTGDDATKSGRTTGTTQGVCIETGVTVRVGYDSFEALFTDQDVYQSVDDDFSAAGDSGSLILSYPDLAPLSLLFAGGAGLTVGNPRRYLEAFRNLEWLW